jgi:phage terminase large subunit-like protein
MGKKMIDPSANGKKGAATLKRKYGKGYFAQLAKDGWRKRRAAARKMAKAR